MNDIEEEITSHATQKQLPRKPIQNKAQKNSPDFVRLASKPEVVISLFDSERLARIIKIDQHLNVKKKTLTFAEAMKAMSNILMAKV